MLKANNTKTANKPAIVKPVASVAETVTLPQVATTANAQYAGLKYIAENNSLFTNVAELASAMLTAQATQAQVVSAACVFYGINAIAWRNAHANKGGKGCLTLASQLAATNADTAALHKALIAQCAAQPKGGKYAGALQALLALGNGEKLQSANHYALAICAVAWAYGYLANKQSNGKKGNVAGAIATLGLPVA